MLALLLLHPASAGSHDLHCMPQVRNAILLTMHSWRFREALL